MIRFKNVIVLVSSLVVLTPLLATGAGCASKSSKAAKKKGAGAKGPAAASAKQKTGSTASGAKASGVSKGADFEGSSCNAETEGVAWCDSDTSVILCSEGAWYAVDCAAIGGDVCATDPDTEIVDCYTVADTE